MKMLTILNQLYSHAVSLACTPPSSVFRFC